MKLCPACDTVHDEFTQPDGVGVTKAPECAAEKSADCELGFWSQWSTCSASCGGGQQERHRQIAKEPKGEGKFCDTALSETAPCMVQACPSACKPVNCQFSPWSVWSACMRGAGQTTRTRWVTKEPSCGGTACNLADLEETKYCTRWSEDEHLFCEWAVWGDWSACSSKCGAATKDRQRNLKVTRMKLTRTGAQQLEGSPGVISKVEISDGDLEGSLEQLYRRQRAGEAKRAQELILAFSCGCIALSVVLFAHRLYSRSGGARQQLSSAYHEVSASTGLLYPAAGDAGAVDTFVE
jgi:hypothetical protein